MLSRFFSLVIICLLGSDIFAEPIDLFEDIIIAGTRHRILIQTDNTENPLVLYLHGGPGYSSVLESNCYAGRLRQNCIFVQWDQKGTGYSYNENIDSSAMSMANFVEDTRMLTEYLLIRFKKKKLFLVGHSWGSALGLYTVLKYPDKYYAFVGVGQIINRKKHINARIDWVYQKLSEAKDTLALETLEKDINTHTGFISQCGGIMHRKINTDSIRRTSPYYSKSYEVLITKGIAFSNKCFTEDKLNEIDFTAIKSVEIPLYFFLGRYDWLTPASFAEEFLKRVKAPDKRIIWFKHSAHLMMTEEPDKFSEELIKILKSVPHEES